MMLEKTWSTVDKSGWQRGMWDDEPDKVQWYDAATSLPCLAVRHPNLGHWCGYVGVAPGHQLHGVDYSDAPYLDVHGGLTYSRPCQKEDDPALSVCHIPTMRDEEENVWWLGFDCAQLGDLSPGMGALTDDEVYRQLEFVRGQCENLAAQLVSTHEDATDG